MAEPRTLWTTPAKDRRPVPPEFLVALESVVIGPEFHAEVARLVELRTRPYRGKKGATDG